MSATDTALRVLAWNSTDTSTAAPEGDVRYARALAEPARPTRRAVARLAAVTAARLRLGAPPLGDARPPGVGAALLAAAVGRRARKAEALRVLDAVPHPETCYDVLAHHGVVGHLIRVEPGLPADLRTALLRASPLTGLLEAPADQTAEFICEAFLSRLMGHAEGRRMVALRLATAEIGEHQIAWRGELLDRYRVTEVDFVLDVYENALAFHGATHRARASAHRTRLDTAPGRAAARNTATWWAALAQIERARPALLRARPRIQDYLVGVRLWWALRSMEG